MIVILKRFSDEHEAEVAKGWLAHNGIKSSIEQDNKGQPFRIKLLVREEDYQQALELVSR